MLRSACRRPGRGRGQGRAGNAPLILRKAIKSGNTMKIPVAVTITIVKFRAGARVPRGAKLTRFEGLE